MRYLALLITFSFLFASQLTFAQDENKAIAETFEQYFDAVEAQDNKTTLDFIYPDFFTIVSKEDMQHQMDQLFANPLMEFSFSKNQINGISPIITDKGIQFALIDYQYLMSITFPDHDPKEDVSVAGLSYYNFQTQYGEENVTFNKEKGIIDITVKTQLYTINNPDYDGWKFIENKEGMEIFYEHIVSEDIRTKLGTK